MIEILNIPHIWKWAVILHGLFGVGMTLAVLLTYAYKRIRHIRTDPDKWENRYVVAISFSHILLTVATIRTTFAEIYQWGDWWFWVVGCGYIATDIGLIIFMVAARRRSKKKLQQLRDHK